MGEAMQARESQIVRELLAYAAALEPSRAVSLLDRLSAAGSHVRGPACANGLQNDSMRSSLRLRIVTLSIISSVG